jgi:hypothetical protein
MFAWLAAQVITFLCTQLCRCLCAAEEAEWPLKVGDPVRALFRYGDKKEVCWPLAMITSVNADGTYDVECDDSEEGVEGALTGVPLSDLRTAGMKEIFSPSPSNSASVAPSPSAPPPPPPPAAPPAAPPAGGEWSQQTDPSSGRAFYVNAATRETRWDPPPSSSSPASPAAPPPLQRPAAPPAGEWSQQTAAAARRGG